MFFEDPNGVLWNSNEFEKIYITEDTKCENRWSIEAKLINRTPGPDMIVKLAENIQSREAAIELRNNSVQRIKEHNIVPYKNLQDGTMLSTRVKRYKEIADVWMSLSVCRDCNSPIDITVAKYDDGLIFKCTNDNCHFSKGEYSHLMVKIL